MISLYSIGNTDFEKNGNAVLVPTEARVHMVAGGNYDLTMTHPMDPEGKWTYLQPGAVLKIPVPEEEIENAYAGMEADVYKITTKTDLREGPSEPETISYTAWSSTTIYHVGDKVSYNSHNYKCNYYDEFSSTRLAYPSSSAWWDEIPRKTAGSPVLVSLPVGTELYWVESYDSTWAKMSTYYGIIGYVKKSAMTYDRHLTPSETKPRVITEQLLRITNVTVDKKSHTVSVTAQHISYDLNGVLVDEIAISQASAGMALARITDGFMLDYPGTIATNITSETTDTTYTNTIKLKSGMYCLMDPDKGIVATFGAALKRDNWDLFVMEKTATDRGFQLRYRKNMIGVNWTKQSDSLVTRVVPVAKDAKGDSLFLPEKWVDSSHINEYPVIRMEQLTVQGQVGKDKGLGDDSTWTESDLLAEMRKKAAERFSVDKADLVQHEVTVDFEMMGATEEYQALKGLESVLLYDSVKVIDEQIGLDVSLEVTELEWDAIKEKVVSIKVSNMNAYSSAKNVTGYNVQNKSIGLNKLSDDVAGEIIREVQDMIPEYADPDAARPGIITVTDSDPTLSWGTRSKVAEIQGSDIHVTMPANPAPAVIDNLTSTSTTDALSANQGKVLNEKIDDQIPNNTNLNSYTTNCVKRSPTTSSGVATLSNCPVSVPFTFICTGAGSISGCVQCIITSGAIYTRRGTSQGFGSWYQFAGTAVTNS